MALSFLLTRYAAPALSAEALFEYYIETGKPDYLERLISLCGNDLYHYLLRQSDSVLAEDISQQCWLKIIERSSSYYQGRSSFKTWLFTVGRNCLIDELRRKQRWQYLDPEQEESADLIPLSQQLEIQQQKLLFEQQLGMLPFLQREALMLQLEGFSLTEIASITAQPAETIKSRLRYARQFLQQFAE